MCEVRRLKKTTVAKNVIGPLSNGCSLCSFTDEGPARYNFFRFLLIFPVLPYGQSRKSWVSKLFGRLGLSNDDDVQQTSRKIPLIGVLEFWSIPTHVVDCVSSKRMTIPCRSIHCGHVECFDYPIWFALRAQGHPKCPICRKVFLHNSTNLTLISS